MSKIYEALLRAELERLGTRPESMAEAAEALPQASIDRLRTAAAAVAAAQPANDAPANPFADVAVRTWTPQFDRLPALLKVASGAEQFRSLRARMYEYRDLNKLKSILVCSGLPQEGKSFVAANLGCILSQGRSSRVLIIDADLRRYTLDKLFGAEHEPGLAEYLQGQASIREVMQRPDLSKISDPKAALALQNITFIPAGAGGDAVVDLGTSTRFADLMAEVEPHFDWVIVDSSPVNLVSDAVHYAHACDGVLLVVRSGATRYENAQKAVAEFKQGSVIGVVLNGSTDAPRAGYYGYGAEGYTAK